MATDTYAKLGQINLSTLNGVVLLYDNTAPTTAIVKHIRLVNQSTSLSTGVCLWLSSVAPVVANTTSLILPTADIAPGGWAEFEGTIILNAGEKLYGAKRNSTATTTADLAVTLYGLEMD